MGEDCDWWQNLGTSKVEGKSGILPWLRLNLIQKIWNHTAHFPFQRMASVPSLIVGSSVQDQLCPCKGEPTGGLCPKPMEIKWKSCMLEKNSFFFNRERIQMLVFLERRWCWKIETEEEWKSAAKQYLGAFFPENVYTFQKSFIFVFITNQIGE